MALLETRANGKHDKYGIVIDSGSSGSRIQIYKWTDPKSLRSSSQQSILQSPPKIIQEKNWTKKISPGISSYNTNSKIKQIWTNHYSKLLQFAEELIPADKIPETPVFVLSTAGMRLLPKATQKKILKMTCSSIKQNTQFYIPDCNNFVQTIDGATEGIYGWLGLNYLMGQFNNYDATKKAHESIGFMDMGGASTQIAFVPSSASEIEKHGEDLAKVTIRNINGQTQTWDVFVATWLGFGANEARKRFLNQLINLSIVNEQSGNEINDPCLPKGATAEYALDGKPYKIVGVGNYEMCTRTIYPLLMKAIPCQDDPCLFNGIHGPKLNFEKDKFIGTSEYWYTANDIFQSGGSYNFKSFNEKVKQYCEMDWKQILTNAEAGKYSNLDPDKFLKDACFKANWVMNILHDGFDLPRLGFEEQQDKRKSTDSDNKPVPFKSADSIKGEELSWTLGKILLFATSQIDSKDSLEIGIYPSEISHKSFVPGGLTTKGHETDDELEEGEMSFSHLIYSLIFVLLLLFFLYHFGRSHFGKWGYRLRRLHIPIQIRKQLSKIPGINQYFPSFLAYEELQQSIDLEEGLNTQNIKPQKPQLHDSILRTRSNLALNEQLQQQSEQANNTRITNFMNKPFLTKGGPGYPETNGREILPRISSNSSIPRSKSAMD
ncbi:Golgi apyrase [Spathaspora sp. JA1]|nr:Golgi apyrase [Spathaspora sp. JA1]